MYSRRYRLLLLHSCPEVTRPLLRRMLFQDEDLLFPFHSTPRQLSFHLKITEKRSSAIIHHIKDIYIMKKLDKYLQEYHCLTLWDQHYPPLLTTIPDPPYVLYGSGDLTILQRYFLLSVVGTRSPSPHAFPAMKTILLPLIQRGTTIVSGMAIGIDQWAHRLAVENDGTTVAVLGSGFNHIYPRNNIALYQQMSTQHLVISEYPPDFPPKKYHFPERNRIISGLSKATFVVEARLRSGSLITVDQALEQGKDVFAMPGLAGSPTSEGCHKMINDGAKLVHTYEDILEETVGKI